MVARAQSSVLRFGSGQFHSGLCCGVLRRPAMAFLQHVDWMNVRFIEASGCRLLNIGNIDALVGMLSHEARGRDDVLTVDLSDVGRRCSSALKFVYRPDRKMLLSFGAASASLCFISEVVFIKENRTEDHFFHDCACDLVCERACAKNSRKRRATCCSTFLVVAM